MKFRRFMDSSSLMALHQSYQTAFRPLLKKLRKESLGLQEALVLLAIFFEGSQPTTPGELQSCLDLPPDQVSHALQRLHQQGLIERQLDPKDQRRRLTRLTSLGKKTATRLVGVFDHHENLLEST